MSIDFVKEISIAIAKANGHPEPEVWAAQVAEHFEPAPAEQVEADSAHVEPEQPVSRNSTMNTSAKSLSEWRRFMVTRTRRAGRLPLPTSSDRQ